MSTIWHLATGDELCKPQKWAGKCGSSENDCPPNTTSIYTLVRTFSWSSNQIYYDVCRSTAPKSPFQFWLPRLWIFDSSLSWPKKNQSQALSPPRGEHEHLNLIATTGGEQWLTTPIINTWDCMMLLALKTRSLTKYKYKYKQIQEANNGWPHWDH